MNNKDRKDATHIGAFVFLDARGRPFYVRGCDDTGGEKMIYYWHPDKKWVSRRKVKTLYELLTMYLSKIPDEEAALYHNAEEGDVTPTAVNP